MLSVSDVTKSFGDSLVLDKINLIVNRGDRVGLVGPNGCGKSTLLRIIVGDESPDSGSVRLTIPDSRVGYLPQALVYDPDTTVRTYLPGTEFQTEADLAGRLAIVAEEMSVTTGTRFAALEREYSEIVERLSGGTKCLPDHVVMRVLAGLGLRDLGPTTPVSRLSGGQKTRLGLARVLLRNPALLLLDEPTNHLDITALEWLEDYLTSCNGGMLVVSHDRTFLDRTVTGILEISPLTHTATVYPGNYTDYVAAREAEEEKHRRAYREQQERIRRLQQASDALRSQARGIEHETVHFHYRKIAKKIAREGVVRQKRIERILESEDHIEKPQLTYQMKLDFLEVSPSGQDVIILENLTKSFGDHCLFKDVNLVLRRGERVMLLGPNGSGKTTLLRIIMGHEAPSAGSARLGASVHAGYLSQEQDNLDWSLSPLQVVRRAAPLTETDARTFLHYYLFAGDQVFVPVGRLSYGERARLALGVLVLRGCNLLLLDEPINHLDLASRDRFERALSSYETMLAVVHDRYFVERLASGIWAIDGGTIRRFIDLEDMRRGATT